ncbi:MAG: hypothetical protein AAF581_01375 [Planctomycetota bacterium]
MIRFSKTHALAMVAAVGLGSAMLTTAQPPEPSDERRRSDRAARIMERFDENGDGKLEKGEVPEMMWERIAGLDGNNDGAITADEINSATGNRGERGERRRRGNPIVDALDTDKDGKLSKAEIAAASASLLTLDKNGDGELTNDELRGPRRGRGGERGEGRGRRGPDGPRPGHEEEKEL